MIFSISIFFQHIHKQSGKIISIRRSSYLIVHNCQSIMCLSQIQHGLDKILSIHTKNPSDADNIIFVQETFHSLFSLIFGLSVNIQRLCYFIIRLPRTCSFSLKHVICTDIDHRDIKCLTYFCNILSTFSIDFSAHFFIVFRCIHCRPCCAVNNAVYLCLTNDRIYCCCICDVHLFNIYTNTFISPLCEFIHNIMAKLTFYSCY